ncbi:uncharacterized protein LOC115219705, partial [Octopus sinensis]|uniref:Uncharacterized protein LOC115219705 n=1 Tax=Octopus sinensis TaxID=2607531 RepID=A0A6P7T7D8_9MOLL
MNENGQRLLELCSYRKLCVTNTFFTTKPQHRVSWRHPRSGHWHQLDMVITRRAHLGSVLLTRSYHGADCDTDHSLVCSRVRLAPKKIRRPVGKSRPRINTARTTNPDLRSEFTNRMEEALKDHAATSIEERWQLIRDTTCRIVMSSLGKRERRNQDWFEAHLPEMEPVIAAKREALVNYKRDPSEKNLVTLRTARSDAQRTARRCANIYWQNLCQNIQCCADSGNVKGMYEEIKKAFRPTVSKVALLKSRDGEVIKDQAKQIERWVEHYQNLYSTENVVTRSALAGIPALPVMEELDLPPTKEELSKAIDSLARGKAPGQDGIPAEVIQCGKPALLGHLHELLCQCWEEGSVPKDMRDANIITLYKNKGDRSDCNNYKGISLLSIVGKAFARVVLKRLQMLAERVYPESQSGFRAERSTIDMIFSLRQLQEKSREQRQPLYVAFIDLAKAFDS